MKYAMTRRECASSVGIESLDPASMTLPTAAQVSRPKGLSSWLRLVPSSGQYGVTK